MDLTTIPAGTPPPGITPNFENPPNLLFAVFVTSAVVQIVTFPFVLLRLCINIFTRRIYTEDVLLYVAWCAFVAQTGLTVYNSSNGMARHFWDISYAMVLEGSYQYNLVFICYAVSGGFAKAVVFLQFKKIFTSQFRDTVYWVIIVSLVVNALAYTILLFVYIFNCWPREKLRDPTVPGQCINWRTSIIAIGIVNLISDIEAFCVPAWAIWRLRLEVKKKFEVFAVFAVGALAIAIACTGLYYRIRMLLDKDTTWQLAKTAMSCIAEIGSVIIVACCPSIPRLFRKQGCRASPSSGYSKDCCHSGGNSRSKSGIEGLDDSCGSVVHRSNSVITLQMYGYANSIDPRESEENMSFGGEDPHSIPRAILPNDTRV